MKKNIIIAAIAAASAILLTASCQKQEQPEFKSEGTTFTATIDQSLTKTVLAEGSTANKSKVNWEAADKISITGTSNPVEYTVSSVLSDPTKATFTGTGAAQKGGKYKAFYPSSLYNSTKEYYELPAVQTYEAGKFNAPMYAESTDENLAFKNICGVICLSLKGNTTDVVKYITILANEGVCGKFTMTDATTLSLSATAGEYSRAVTLDCGEGVALSSTAKNFYIYLPPKTYTAGMKFIITTTDSRVFENETQYEATIERNKIYTFDNWGQLSFSDKPALLSGKFTVETGKQVQFTKGNLYHSNSGWALEANQFDFRTWNGKSAVTHGVTTTTQSGDAGLLYWTMEAANSYNESYTESGTGTTDKFFCYNCDDSFGSLSGLYALSSDEWSHLFTGRDSYANKYGYATVANVEGIIILPDTFSDPYAGIKEFNSTTGWTANVYSAADWIAMESEGAVFLPAAGFREGSDVGGSVGNSGGYWSSTADDESYANSVFFDSKDFFPDNIDPRHFGFSVRLVYQIILK